MNFSVIAGLIEKYYYVTINRLDRIFDIVYWPVVGLLVWGFTASYMKEFAGQSIVYALLGATVLWIFFQRAAQDISVYILEDFWSRNLFNLFAAPVKTSEIVTSIAIFGGMRALAGAVVLTFSALLFYSFNILQLGAVSVAISSFNLLLFGWVIGFFVSSFIFMYGMRIQVLAWSIPFLVQPFSAVYYPLSSMPQWVQAISRILPSTYVFEAMRASLSSNVIPWMHFATAFLINIAMIILVCFFFGYSITVAKKKGLFVRSE